MTTTYWEYIQLDQLLSIQSGLEGPGDVALADELHFIGIHQSIEIIFKLLLRELRAARGLLGANYVPEHAMPEVVKHLGRANEALRVTIAHFRYMELLTPLDFMEFRAKLGTSSGAQSFQMRELEHLMGLGQDQRHELLRRLRARLARPEDADPFTPFVLDPLGAIQSQINAHITRKEAQGLDASVDKWSRQHIQKAMDDIETQGTLRSALEKWLFRTPICDSTPPPPNTPIDDQAFAEDQRVVRHFVEDYIQRGKSVGWNDGHVQAVRQFLGAGQQDSKLDWHTERVRAALLFIETYLDLPLLALPRMVLEKVVELEKLASLFRGAHARMAERVIGNRPGTGGSPGLIYLDLTRDLRVFPELIQIRGILIPRDRRWAFPGMEEFGFKLGQDDGCD